MNNLLFFPYNLVFSKTIPNMLALCWFFMKVKKGENILICNSLDNSHNLFCMLLNDCFAYACLLDYCCYFCLYSCYFKLPCSCLIILLHGYRSYANTDYCWSWYIIHDMVLKWWFFLFELINIQCLAWVLGWQHIKDLKELKIVTKTCVEQVIVERQILLAVQIFEDWFNITSWQKKRNEVSIVQTAMLEA